MSDLLAKAVDQLALSVKPFSVFVYGSRARGDDNDRSDYEIGVIMRGDRLAGSHDLARILSIKNLSAYPYIYEDLIEGKIATPFQKSIFLREIAATARTVYGERVVENLVPPPLMAFDAMMDLRFQVGRALATLIEVRNGDMHSASENFYKSCVLGSRLLIIESTARFPISYKEIMDAASDLAPSEYSGLMDLLPKLRQGCADPSETDCYFNISWLSDYIEPRLMAALNDPNHAVLIP